MVFFAIFDGKTGTLPGKAAGNEQIVNIFETVVFPLCFQRRYGMLRTDTSTQ